MKKQIIAFLFLALCFVSTDSFAQKLPAIKAKVVVSQDLIPSFQKSGRLILYLSKQRGKEPRFSSDITVGVTASDWNPSVPFTIDTRNKEVMSLGIGKLSEKPSEKYYYQVVYKQNIEDGQENVPGNIYSDVDSIAMKKGVILNVKLSKLVPPFEIATNKFVKTIIIQSKYLSDFSGHPRYLKSSILLPSGYFDHPEKTYPICYRAPGLNGRYTKVNTLISNKEFSDWWFSKDAPQIIYVFLDSQGPYGDTYQVDSENNGPCGKALTEELIPEIEKQVGYRKESHLRFLTGYSTGGWIALGLQIFYPDFFDGTWSYSPDPVDFEHYGLINIYKDETIFYNPYGYLQPGKRTIYGEPIRSMKDWIADENIRSRTGNYLVSGAQFGAYNAVFGPKGKDGLPSLMFDPITGKIDHAIAQQWEIYDLKKVLEKNWSTLGPKLQGKIWIWTGDMDDLYSNVATRFLKIYLDKTENPKSDARVLFTPMAGHCQEWNDKSVLLLIEQKVAGK